jgi:hypothetical protein
MRPIFRSTSVSMKDDKEDQRGVSRWALPGSVAVHLLVVLLIIFGLPLPLFEAEDEQAINVDLVPPPKAPEKAKAEPPPPAKRSEKPEEKKADKPPPEGNEAAKAAPQPVLNPVFQFGEKDAGPRQSPDGNSAQEGSASPEPEREPDKQEPAKPPAVARDAPDSNSAEDASASPETEREPDKKDVAGPQALTADKSTDQAAPPQIAPKTPAPKPTQAAKKQEAAKPREAKKLFSQKATGEINATTAMADLPRDVRAGRLCVTELREQLQNGLPPYYPDLLPSYRLEEGTVIDVPTAAFRVAGEWYDLSYRCQVDANATRVVDFAFRVGGLLPRSEWRRRKLPAR